MPTTWNPSDAGSNISLTNENLTAVCSDPTTNRVVRSTTSKTVGKWYFELLLNPVVRTEPNLQAMGGIATASADKEVELGESAGGWAIWYVSNNLTWHVAFFGGGNDIGGPTTNEGDILGFFLDLDNNLFYLRLNSANLYGNPAAQTGGFSIPAGTYYAAASGRIISSTPGQITANFGANNFAYVPPAGFIAWDAFPIQSFTTSITSITRLRKPVGV